MHVKKKSDQAMFNMIQDYKKYMQWIWFKSFPLHHPLEMPARKRVKQKGVSKITWCLLPNGHYQRKCLKIMITSLVALTHWICLSLFSRWHSPHQPEKSFWYFFISLNTELNTGSTNLAVHWQAHVNTNKLELKVMTMLEMLQGTQYTCNS